MATNTAGTSARQDPRQVLNTIKRTINYNDSDVAGAFFGTGPTGNALPRSAYIVDVMVEVVTAFNAGTTNTLSVGTNSGTWTNIVSATDVAANSAGVTRVSRGVGRSLLSSADTSCAVVYTQSGTAATTGSAVITITFEGGFSS